MGGFCQVRLATHNATHRIVAVKIVEKNQVMKVSRQSQTSGPACTASRNLLVAVCQSTCPPPPKQPASKPQSSLSELWDCQQEQNMQWRVGREIGILKHMKHPRINALHGVIDTPDRLFILLQV